MDKGFIILNSLMYTKFFLTEAILSETIDDNNKTIPYAIVDLSNFSNHSQYTSDMMSEMSYYREQFSNTYNHYSNATVTFSKEYQDYTANTQVYIKTLSNGVQTIEHQPFSTAMSRIPTSIFYVSTVTDQTSSINMKDRNAFELMQNLLNDYLLVWRSVTFLLVDDVIANAKSSKSLVFIFGFSFLISVLCLIGLWKLITRFIDDREKPVDLFLTIKRTKFDELKASSEAFTNKLLNKCFGNEETEEESLVDYSTNLKQDDININRFKQKKDYKQTLRTSTEYLLNYIKMVIFFIIIQAYLTFKFCYSNGVMKNINNFAHVFNVTHFSQSDIILSIDITKSFFYSETINVLNSSETEKIFKETFVDISNSFESLLIVSYNTSCFLQGNYINNFYNWINNDISSMVTNMTIDDTSFLGTLKYGFKSTISRYFELIRFIGINYLKMKTDNETDFYSLLNKTEFYETNNIVLNVIRP